MAIAAGFIILSRPGVGSVTLVAVLSALLVVLGIARDSAAFKLRRLGASWRGRASRKATTHGSRGVVPDGRKEIAQRAGRCELPRRGRRRP